MNITRITPPKYKVGRYTLNEYELRCLMSEVAEGKKIAPIKVKDEKGNTAAILPNGRLDVNIYGLDINSNYTLAVIRIERSKNSK
jgi:hypothetical protein